MSNNIYVVTSNDRAILRELAKHVKEIANSPVMQERVRAWTLHNDLTPTRPMVLLELSGLGPELELLHKAFPEFGGFMKRQCEGDFAHGLESNLKWRCMEHMTINDDSVVDDCFNIPWEVDSGHYGVDIKTERGTGSDGRSLSFHTTSPITDVTKALDFLKPREFSCNREPSLAKKAAVEDIFGDILNVRMRGTYWWTMGLTWRLIELIGMENMMVGMAEEPEAIHAIMDFLCDDHIRFARFLEGEGLFCLNTQNDYVGSGSRGFTSCLPHEGKRPDGGANLKDCWVLLESQETVSVSPGMFNEFVLPYHKKIAEIFGFVYYGCCEPIDKRIGYIKTIGNLRSVSVSPWCNEETMARECAGKYVYSRKPAPSLLSGHSVDYSEVRRDIEATFKKASDCNLEIVMKDLHTVSGDIARVKNWVDMARSYIIP